MADPVNPFTVAEEDSLAFATVVGNPFAVVASAVPFVVTVEDNQDSKEQTQATASIPEVRIPTTTSQASAGQSSGS